MIPLHAHFVWLGRELPWVNVLAIRSAVERGGFEGVTLHHDQDLSHGRHYAALAAIIDQVDVEVELRPLDVDGVLDRCGRFTAGLRAAWERAPAAAIRADVLRLAILHAEGGIYLDLDTVTVRSLGALCAGADAFCGEERIVFPERVRSSWNPAVLALGQVRNGVRDLLAAVPHGWAAFRRIERFYPGAVNNAVVGSAPGGRFITRALERLIELPPDVQTRRCGMGPHLLQEIAPELAPPDLVVHPPPVFYPLGPEVSRHWFYVRGGGGGGGDGAGGDGAATGGGSPDDDDAADDGTLGRVLLPETRVVHWYASTSRIGALTSAIDPDYVRAHAGRQLFSTLALPFAGPP